MDRSGPPELRPNKKPLSRLSVPVVRSGFAVECPVKDRHVSKLRATLPILVEKKEKSWLIQPDNSVVNSQTSWE